MVVSGLKQTARSNLHMLQGIKYGRYFLLAFLFCQPLFAQGLPVHQPGNRAPADSGVIVGAVLLSGNKKTKASVIYRELAFRSGERYSLEDLVQRMNMSRGQLMNTTLFNEVLVAAKDTRKDTLDISVEVKERWYLVPVLYVKPVDRNFNQWLVEQKADLDRVNYGVRIFYNNVTGLKDNFSMLLMSGYTRQIALNYEHPYLDKDLKWGFRLQFAKGKNREVNYKTIGGKQAFFKDPDRFLRHFSNGSAELTYRPAIRTRHSFGAGYLSEEIADTITRLNPGYFSRPYNRVTAPVLYYSLFYFDADYIPYPTKGTVGTVYFSKTGIGSRINLWELHVRSSSSWKISRRSFVNMQWYGGLKLPFRQPFFNQRFLGYRDVFLQGFEYYVVDGVAGGYTKLTAARELASFRIRPPAVKRDKQPGQIPFRIYGKVFANAGYVHHPDPGQGSLSNQWLYSGGLGIDIVTFYDLVIKLEWSFNSLGENGLFLHRKTNF